MTVSTSWTHPTGNQPASAILVCLGPSRNTYVSGLLEHDLADACTGMDEVWTLNRGGNAFKHDLLWVMDHIQGEADKHPRYGASLWKHDKPIITSDNLDGWPPHVRRYPFEAIWNWLAFDVNPMHGDWFHNSLAYILVYAAWIGIKELRVFGADYANHHSGVVEDGHPCVAYWVGRLESVGLTVKVPEESQFLGCNQRRWIYGYRHDPRTIPTNRKRFRDLVGLPAEESAVGLLNGERQVAPVLDRIQPDHVERYKWAAVLASGTVYDLGCGIGYGSAILADAPQVDSVLAIDRSAESIEYAVTHYDRPKIQHFVIDFNRSGNFVRDADWAVAFELIEHLPDPKPLLRGIPARRLLASVPNEEKIPYSPQSAPHHHRHYTRYEFTDLLRETGWRPVAWRGQMDREGPVVGYRDDCRTIVVEAERCPDADLSNSTADSGESAS